MTICIEKFHEQAKFFKKCLFKENGCKDCTYPYFERIDFTFGFPTIHIETDKTTEEVENILKEAKVKYLWVNQY